MSKSRKCQRRQLGEGQRAPLHRRGGRRVRRHAPAAGRGTFTSMSLDRHVLAGSSRQMQMSRSPFLRSPAAPRRAWGYSPFSRPRRSSRCRACRRTGCRARPARWDRTPRGPRTSPFVPTCAPPSRSTALNTIGGWLVTAGCQRDRRLDLVHVEPARRIDRTGHLGEAVGVGQRLRRIAGVARRAVDQTGAAGRLDRTTSGSARRRPTFRRARRPRRGASPAAPPCRWPPAGEHTPCHPRRDAAGPDRSRSQTECGSLRTRASRMEG